MFAKTMTCRSFGAWLGCCGFFTNIPHLPARENSRLYHVPHLQPAARRGLHSLPFPDARKSSFVSRKFPINSLIPKYNDRVLRSVSNLGTAPNTVLGHLSNLARPPNTLLCLIPNLGRTRNTVLGHLSNPGRTRSSVLGLLRGMEMSPNTVLRNVPNLARPPNTLLCLISNLERTPHTLLCLLPRLEIMSSTPFSGPADPLLRKDLRTPICE